MVQPWDTKGMNEDSRYGQNRLGSLYGVNSTVSDWLDDGKEELKDRDFVLFLKDLKENRGSSLDCWPVISVTGVKEEHVWRNGFYFR